MNTIVFERQTSKGNLSCQIKSQYLSQENFVVEFYLDGNFVPKNYGAGIAINILTVEFLKDKDFAKEIYPKLVSLGATALWNGQIALYGDEPEKIKLALKQAKMQREAEEDRQLKESDIVVTERRYNHLPAKAENELFTWHWLNPDNLKCKKTGKFIYRCEGVDEDTLNAACQFQSDIYLIIKAAEKSYAKAKQEKEQAEREKRGENPWTKGLTPSEIKRKAKEWDDINNEGGEGYNPYYHW